MNKTLVVIGIIVLLLVGGIFALKSFTGNSVKESDVKYLKENDVKEFQVKAFKFGYSSDVIEVNKGDKVKIIVENTDALHGMRIPDLGIKGNEVLEFTADKQGEFIWSCNNMCGEGHREMQGKLIVK